MSIWFVLSCYSLYRLILPSGYWLTLSRQHGVISHKISQPLLWEPHIQRPLLMNYRIIIIVRVSHSLFELSIVFPGETEENHGNFRQNSLCHIQCLKLWSVWFLSHGSDLLNVCLQNMRGTVTVVADIKYHIMVRRVRIKRTELWRFECRQFGPSLWSMRGACFWYSNALGLKGESGEGGNSGFCITCLSSHFSSDVINTRPRVIHQHVINTTRSALVAAIRGPWTSQAATAMRAAYSQTHWICSSSKLLSTLCIGVCRWNDGWCAVRGAGVEVMFTISRNVTWIN